MRSHHLTAVLLLLLAPSLLPAGAELLLKDGQVFQGESVERKGDYYLLKISEEEVLPVPLELVAEMRLTGDDAEDATGFKPAVAETLVGDPEARMPRKKEQLEVFEEPAEFAPDLIDPVWELDLSWPDGDPGVEFNPVRWYEPPINPNWTPRSHYKQSGDVTQFNPVHWYRPPIESTWRPRDAFGSTVWFGSVIRSRE